MKNGKTKNYFNIIKLYSLYKYTLWKSTFILVY